MSIILGITGTFEGYTTSPLNFYVDGTWSNMTTTGTTVVENSGSFKRVNDTDAIRITNNTTSGIQMGSSSYFSWLLNSAVNLNGYNYVKVKVTSGSSDMKFVVGVSTSTTATSYTNSTTSESVGTLILNVSSLSGNYFIYFKIIGNNSTTVRYPSSVGSMNLASVDLIQVTST